MALVGSGARTPRVEESRLAVVTDVRRLAEVLAGKLGCSGQCASRPASASAMSPGSMSYAHQPLFLASANAIPGNTMIVLLRLVVKPHEATARSISSPAASGQGCQSVAEVTR